MQTNMMDYCLKLENFLDEKFCDQSINVLDSASYVKHEWDGYGESFADDEATNKADFANKYSDVVDFDNTTGPGIEEIDKHIIVNLKDAFLKYLGAFKYGWFRGWQGYTGIKFNRYTEGQEMRLHWDNIHSMFDGERRGVPILSVIGLLNDDYEGGELYISENKTEMKKGDLIIFPCSFMYPHEVKPVTKGVRHSYVSWLW
jgi:hypothetical protein